MALGTKALKELARSLDAARDCLRDSAGGDDTPAVDELGAYREGQLLKKQLLEARASRLCRFLELTGGSGCTPRAATSGVSSGGGGGGGGGAHWGAQSKGQTPAVRRRLGSLDDSAEEADSSPRGGRKAAHWHSPGDAPLCQPQQPGSPSAADHIHAPLLARCSVSPGGCRGVL